jgi:hypothetical protein
MLSKLAIPSNFKLAIVFFKWDMKCKITPWDDLDILIINYYISLYSKCLNVNNKKININIAIPSSSNLSNFDNLHYSYFYLKIIIHAYTDSIPKISFRLSIFSAAQLLILWLSKSAILANM